LKEEQAMADLAGYTFKYEGGEPQPTQLLGWQICLAHPETQSLEDADNYADYAVNRDAIVQALGMGMMRGQNAFQLNDQLFVVLVAENRRFARTPPHRSDAPFVLGSGTCHRRGIAQRQRPWHAGGLPKWTPCALHPANTC